MIELACATCCLWDWSLDRILPTYRSLGYRAVELAALSADRHLDVTAWDAPRLRALLDAHGLALAAVYPAPVNTMTAPDYDRSMAYVRRAIDLAADVGCRRIVFTPIHFPREAVDYPRIAAACLELAAHVGDRDVVICLENHHNFPLSTADDYERLFAHLGDDRRVGITVDTGHFTASGVDVPALIDRWRDRVYHVHLKDHVGARSVPFGAGRTDNAAAVARLRAVGYAGYASVELEVEDKSETVRYLADAKEYCERRLGIS